MFNLNNEGGRGGAGRGAGWRGAAFVWIRSRDWQSVKAAPENVQLVHVLIAYQSERCYTATATASSIRRHKLQK